MHTIVITQIYQKLQNEIKEALQSRDLRIPLLRGICIGVVPVMLTDRFWYLWLAIN